MSEEMVNTNPEVGVNTDVNGGTEPQVQPQAGNEPASTPQTLEFEIDGIGKVTPDQIKEYKQGFMRQSDYTRKTQEIARQRQENKEALDLYNYLKSNPQIAQALYEGNYSVVQGDPTFQSLNPAKREIANIQDELANIKLDSTIERLKSQYKDFDEVAVLTEAEKRGISDLEFVYKALQGDKLPNLKDQIAKEIRTQLTDEIRKNGIATDTIISNNDTPPTTVVDGLSAEELAIAKKMGLSPEKYAKGKN